MNRRDLLKGAAVAPVVALGTLLAGSPAEAGIFGGGALEGYIENIYPGGGLAPESQNGGDIIIKFRDESDTLRTALVDGKSAIFITGVKTRYRWLLNQVYTNQETVLAQFYGLPVRVQYRAALKVKKIWIG